MRFFTRILILFMFCLGGAASAFAVPTVSLSSGGNGVFVLHASDFKSIGGVHVILTYDTSTLTNPRVTLGPVASGAAMFLNTGTPGVINMPLAKPGGLAAESGVIATISFDLIGNPPGVITSLKANLSKPPIYKAFAARTINPFTQQTPESTAEASNGSTSAVITATTGTTTTTDTATPAATTNAAAGTTTTTTTASQEPFRTLASGLGASLVADTAPSASPEENKRGAAEAPAEVAQEKGAPRESEPAASETPAVASIDLNKDALQTLEQRVAAEAKPSRVAYRSVLEQLRGFTGKSTPKALSELFVNQSLEGVRQEPAIALADGSSKVRVFVAPRSGASSIPKFSLSGASLVALTPEPDGSWMVEVLPAKGSYNATITMLQGGAETVIPLLVAPPMGAGEQGKLTESGFARFLADRGTEKAPRFDLNGDGRRDYLDDYIFTANYLVKKGSGENSGKSLPKKLPEAGRQ